MSPSLSGFIGYGVVLEQGTTAAMCEAEDALRGPECYNYAHYHPDYSHDWSDERQEQFEEEHADEIQKAKNAYGELADRYLADIETAVVGVMDFVQDAVIYEPTYQGFGYTGSKIDHHELELTPEEVQKAEKQIHMYLDLLNVGEQDIERGPAWIGGAAYW